MNRQQRARCILVGLTVLALLQGANWVAAQSAAQIEKDAERNLHVLGHALARYLLYNEGQLPARISELYEQKFILELDAFTSPGSKTKISIPSEIDQKTDYYLTLNPAKDRPLLLLKEKKGFHDGKALAYYSDRKIKKEEPGFPSRLLEASGLLRVPDVAGLTAPKARERIELAGLKAVFQLGITAPSAERSLQVQQTAPAGGVLVGKGSEVKVTLFAAAAALPDGKTRVPNVEALTAPKAKELIEQAGLRAEFQLGRAAPAPAQASRVYQTSPASDALVAKDSVVTVTLYAAPETSGTSVPTPEPKDGIVVPNCVTLSVDEATAKLTTAGFTVTTKVGRAASFAGQVERVYQMEPAPGSRLPRGETVRLIVFGTRDKN